MTADKADPQHGILRGPSVPATLIREILCEAIGCSLRDLDGPNRSAPLVQYRQLAMYLCVHHSDLSRAKVGALFGGRDHTTVLHALKAMEAPDRTDLHLLGEVVIDRAYRKMPHTPIWIMAVPFRSRRKQTGCGLNPIFRHRAVS